MGQKVHPNIFRLGKTKNWNAKFVEAKTIETGLQSFNNLEIKKFIYSFFEKQGLIIQNCKLNYSNEGSLHVFVSFKSTYKTIYLIQKITTKQKIKIRRRRGKRIKGIELKLTKNAEKYTEHQKTEFNKLLKKLFSIKYKKVKNIVKRNNYKRKILRNYFLKRYKKYLATKKYQQLKSIQTNSFLKKFFISLHLFLNKKTNIFLTTEQLNKNIKVNFSLNKKKLDSLKRNLVLLRKYNQSEFFKEGVNILFLCANNQLNQFNLLAKFIAIQLKKLKQHNFFFNFIKTSLTLFKNEGFLNLQGLKIKVKGRLKGALRARHKFIKIGNGVSLISLKKNINYSENTAFTSKGTIGIKIWVHQKNN